MSDALPLGGEGVSCLCLGETNREVSGVKKRLALTVVLGAVVLTATIVGGCSSIGQTPTGGRSGGTAQSTTKSDGGTSMGSAGTGADAAGSVPANVAEQSPAPANSSAANATKMVVTTAAMSVEVKDVAKAVETVRGLASAAGAEVADLKFTAGVDAENPVPLDSRGGASSTQGPANAQIALRVPAAKLADVQHRVGALGKVTTQSSNQSDVTQQHVDMTARLANLRAEEAQLRSIMSRAGKISDLLEVERELARVRGDIESMQAQVAYLERQAAMSTLTISLSQPGPLVRPSASNWGFADAFTTGVQAAAEVARTLIMGVVALSPLILLGLAIWGVIWLVRRRRARSAEPSDAEQAGQE